MSASERLAVGGLLLLIVATACVSWYVVGTDYWCDDAFISFRYGKNLASGHGLVYNPGERVEGYTNALWTVLAAGWIRAGIDPMAAAQWTSLVAQALTLWLLFSIGRRGGLSPLRALLAPVLLATQLDFLAYPMTGMESSLFALLVTVALGMVLRDGSRRSNDDVEGSRNHSLALGVTLGAIVLTRFDGFVLAGILLAAQFLGSRESFGRRIRGLAPTLSVLLPVMAGYNLWRLAYYGSALPNTFYAKTRFSLPRLRVGLSYVVDFFSDERAALLVLAILAVFVVSKSRRSRILASVIGLQLVYVVLVGGDWMPHHRFLLPVLPALALLAQEGVWGCWDRLGPRAHLQHWVVGCLVVLVVGSLTGPMVRARPFGEFSVKAFDPQHAREIGRALAEQLPPDALIAVEWGGIVPYYAGLPTLELFGLTDYDMAHSDLRLTVWGRRPTPEYVARRGPKLIVACARLFDTRSQARSCGRQVGRGWFRAYTSPKMEPFGYRFEVRQAGERFWPAWVRAGDPTGRRRAAGTDQ